MIFLMCSTSNIVFVPPVHRHPLPCSPSLRYGFVASPVGHGLDSHRTWEALALGCIVLVEASAIDAIFSENSLPVVAVPSLKAWAAFTAQSLQELLDR